jgi:hypothetical protein
MDYLISSPHSFNYQQLRTSNYAINWKYSDIDLFWPWCLLFRYNSKVSGWRRLRRGWVAEWPMFSRSYRAGYVQALKTARSELHYFAP